MFISIPHALINTRAGRNICLHFLTWLNALCPVDNYEICSTQALQYYPLRPLAAAERQNPPLDLTLAVDDKDEASVLIGADNRLVDQHRPIGFSSLEAQ
ncbi:hypothetical protein J2T28_001458 [Kerstersia gyiorum]|uniref:hypothetical protein n=1 Tax=Kerstersia gyiorum TaxID=206506 RepID=UPI0020A0FDDD|nr:hypothetical protein [Kerstersia gyiorum]MCP1636368.1 hypothetical protein [Kerstersia gyiorum]